MPKRGIVRVVAAIICVLIALVMILGSLMQAIL
jgi:hypothetical protein